MTYEIYKALHLIGLVLLFLGLGGMLAGAGKEGSRPKVFAILHAVGLLVMLVAGFGLLARLGLGWPGWVFAKVAVWLLLGGLPPLVRRGKIPAALGWVVAAGLGAVAVWLVIARPF